MDSDEDERAVGVNKVGERLYHKTDEDEPVEDIDEKQLEVEVEDKVGAAGQHTGGGTGEMSCAQSVLLLDLIDEQVSDMAAKTAPHREEGRKERSLHAAL